MEEATVNDNREAGRRRTKGSRQRKSPGLLERIQPDAAGIDCGAEYHYVAVPPDRDPEPVRPFRTFTPIWSAWRTGSRPAA